MIAKIVILSRRWNNVGKISKIDLNKTKPYGIGLNGPGGHSKNAFCGKRSNHLSIAIENTKKCCDRYDRLDQTTIKSLEVFCMASPKGNKFAVGNTGGRPADWIPELVQGMCNKLVAWAEKEDAFIFPQFCVQEKITMRQFYYLKESHQEFAEAFSYAKALLACRLVLKTGKDKEIHPSLSLRYIKYYDEFLYRFDREEKASYNLAIGMPPFAVEDYAKYDLEEPFCSMYKENLSKRK